MMNKLWMMGGCAALAIGLAACGPAVRRVDLNDPNSVGTLGSSAITVSYTECADAAQVAAQDMLSSKPFQRFLNQYRREIGDPDAVPLLQISDYLANETNDPNLNMKMLTDILSKTIRDSGLVRVTLVAGRDAKRSAADARDLSGDDNFNQNTVMRKGTLNAPDLSLEGAFITQTTRNTEGRLKVTTFNLKLMDLVTGEEVWSYNKAIGNQFDKSYF